MSAPNDTSGAHVRVPGHCPACGAQTLYTMAGGHIRCTWSHCPRPTAVDELLQDSETEHVVQFGEAGFTIRHPLQERLDDALMECRLHQVLVGMAGPPVTQGRYRARETPGTVDGYSWQELVS